MPIKITTTELPIRQNGQHGTLRWSLELRILDQTAMAHQTLDFPNGGHGRAQSMLTTRKMRKTRATKKRTRMRQKKWIEFSTIPNTYGLCDINEQDKGQEGARCLLLVAAIVATTVLMVVVRFRHEGERLKTFSDFVFNKLLIRLALRWKRSLHGCTS